jgi:hypothetical protein
MSFGYGVGDFLSILQLAKQIVEACLDGPPEFRELSREIQSFEVVINRISSDAKNPQSRLNRKGAGRKKDFDQIVENCKITMEEIGTYVDKHSSIARSDGGATGAIRKAWSSYQVGSEDLNNMRGKLIFWVSCINSFLSSLDPAAQTRIEYKLDLLMEKLGLASSDAGVSANSVASVVSVFSFHDGSPDEDSWKLIQRSLLEDGVSESDIDDNKERIIQYVKELVISSLPASDTESSTLQAPSATQAWTKSIARRRNFLAKLDQYALYSQQLGKSLIDFKVQKIHNGVIYSEPASCVSFDIWIRSERSRDSRELETNVRLRITHENQEVLPTSNDPPLIVKVSPSWMKRSVKDVSTASSRVGAVEVPINAIGAGISGAGVVHNSPKIFEGESTTSQWQMSTEWTIKAISSPKDRRAIVWHIRQLQDRFRGESQPTESSLHLRMAVVVEHGDRPFNMEVELSDGRTSLFRNLVRERPSVNKMTILPETGTSLEEVNLDQRKYMVDPLLEVQNHVNQDEEVGLEYDGNHFTMRMGAQHDLL